MEVELIYTVVLISAVHQRDSVIYIYILFVFSCIVVYHRIAKRVPRANQEDLVYPSYTL